MAVSSAVIALVSPCVALPCGTRAGRKGRGHVWRSGLREKLSRANGRLGLREKLSRANERLGLREKLSRANERLGLREKLSRANERLGLREKLSRANERLGLREKLSRANERLGLREKLSRANKSMSNKAVLVARMVSWKKVADAPDEEEEEKGCGEGNECDDWDDDGALWRKTIIRGERCRSLDFSGKILYDSEGNRMP
ncbi:hypothetical protein MLD38_001569 [Melastoma candidum]|uniref:Uncharacterized protein n=1 Tax=Melastoma candidum TaxID=119954 RepID=A0ACB9SE38_9MYRT|nr:hypothetical protein MLD38_001569 [Melastoma candidum]